MRVLWKALFLMVIPAAAGCQLFKLAQAAPIGGTNLKVTDSLLTAGGKMFHTRLIFFSPSVPGLEKDAERQRKFDEAGDRTKPRVAWALRYMDTPDLLDITIHAPQGDAEKLMRKIADSVRASAASMRLVVQEDTVEWNDRRREYRQTAHDPKTQSVHLVRCVPAMIQALAGWVSCYEAQGPTADRTLMSAIAGLTAPGYKEFVSRTVTAAIPPLLTPREVRAASATPERPTEIGIANGKAFNVEVGFVLPASPATVINVHAQEKFDSIAPTAGMLGFALADTAGPALINISAMPQGQWPLDEQSWTQHVEHSLQLEMKGSPGSSLLSEKNEWRADTASYRSAFVDQQGIYHKTFCKGSAIGRVKPTAVCVHTMSMQADAYDDMGSRFFLTRPGANPTADIKEMR